MKSFIFNYDMSLDMKPLSGELTFTEDGTIKSVVNGNSRKYIDMYCWPINFEPQRIK